MELLTPEIREKLLANGRNRKSDHTPVVRFFNPAGAGTWLVTDADPEDTDIVFALADLGMGSPELGSVRLSEIQAFRGPFGLGIERDLSRAIRSRCTLRPRGAPAASSNSAPNSTAPPGVASRPPMPAPEHPPTPFAPRPGHPARTGRFHFQPHGDCQCPISEPGTRWKN